MSASISGTTYTSLVSGITITSGGASNVLGGREIPTLISTSAIAAVGTPIANPKRIVPPSNCFIVSPPRPPRSHAVLLHGEHVLHEVLDLLLRQFLVWHLGIGKLRFRVGKVPL